MRIILLYILLVAFGCQQTTVNGQQTPFLESENLKTSESEKSCEPRAMSNEQKSPNVQGSQHEAQSLKKTVDYFENQIRLADSLYKNYLPQYNFEEVKAAVMFFDSLRLTTDLLESENLKTSKSEKSSEPRAMSHEQRFRKAQSSQHEAQSLKKTVDCCPLTVDYFESQIRLADSLYKNYLPQYNFEEVKAAVMFFDSLRLTTDLLESENLKNSESEKGCEQRAMSNEPFLESKKSVNISEICGNEKTNHKLVQKKSEKGCEPRAMSHETFLESENLKNSESEKGCEPRAISNETFLESENLKTSKSEKSCEPRAMSHEQSSAKLKAHSTKPRASKKLLTVVR